MVRHVRRVSLSAYEHLDAIGVQVRRSMDFPDYSENDRLRLAHDIATLSAEICLTGSNNPEHMIARGVQALAKIVDSSSTALAWLEEPAKNDRPPRMLHFASSNSDHLSGEPDEAWFYDCSDDSLDQTDREQLCFRRADITPDEEWRGSPLAEKRASGGLYDFVRAIASCAAHGEPRLLHIELAGLTKDWRPSDYDLDLVCAASTIMRAAYIHRKVLPDDARRDLLERLTPSQRQVAMLLVENVMETEIASIVQRSRHTIHDHIKAVFRSWKVHSRAEAIALWRHPLDPLRHD